MRTRSWTMAATFAVTCLSLTARCADPSQTPAAPESSRVTEALTPYVAPATNYTAVASRQPLAAIEETIRKASPAQYGEIETWLLWCFQLPTTTTDFKEFACCMLQVIGSANSIPVMASLLLDERLSDFAIRALQHIPDPRVDEALRTALPQSTGIVKIGIVNAMGERAQPTNGDVLTSLVEDADATVSVAAIVALGKIGGGRAIEVLMKACLMPTPAIQAAAMRACLDVAQRLLAQGEKDTALKVFEEIAAMGGGAKPVQAAAFRGRVTARGEDGLALLVEAIQSGAPELWVAAMECVREIPGTNATQQLAAVLPSLAGKHKAQLLCALADRGDKAALAAMIAAIQDNDDDSRAAAYDALAVMGDGATAVALVKAAAQQDPHAEAARECVKRMPGKDVTATLIKELDTTDEALVTEIVRSLAARRSPDAMPPLLALAKSGSESMRLEALKALGSLAQDNALSPLLDLLAGATTDAANDAAATALAATANRSAGSPQNTSILLSALAKARSPQAKCALLNALGNTDDETALNNVRQAIGDPAPEVQDTAIRTLAAWPSPQALPVLLEIATSSPRMTHRILALRGHIRLLEYTQDWSVAQKLAAYGKAMELATRAEEKRQILGGVASMAAPEALSFVEPYLNDSELGKESVAAVLKIAAAITATSPSQARAALVKAQSSNKDEAVARSIDELLGKLHTAPAGSP